MQFRGRQGSIGNVPTRIGRYPNEFVPANETRLRIPRAEPLGNAIEISDRLYRSRGRGPMVEI